MAHQKLINGSTYTIGLHDGLAEVAFDVCHHLQPYLLRSQQRMSSLFTQEDVDRIKGVLEDHDDTDEGKAEANKAADQLSQQIFMEKMGQAEEIEIIIDVLKGLSPKVMRQLFADLITETICEDGALRDPKVAGDHFRTRRSSMYPLMAEIIRVNSFFDMDISSLINDPNAKA